MQLKQMGNKKWCLLCGALFISVAMIMTGCGGDDKKSSNTTKKIENTASSTPPRKNLTSPEPALA